MQLHHPQLANDSFGDQITRTSGKIKDQRSRSSTETFEVPRIADRCAASDVDYFEPISVGRQSSAQFRETRR